MRFLIISVDGRPLAARAAAARHHARGALPQHGFADSLNVGVAAALALSEVTAALGAGGDLIAGDWRPEDADPAALREKWARHLSRDEAQLAAIRDALGAGIAVLDDLRRAPEFRKHTGKKHKPHK